MRTLRSMHSNSPLSMYSCATKHLSWSNALASTNYSLRPNHPTHLTAPPTAPHTEIHYLELSSLTSPATQIAQPFLFITRSVLLLIESGALDPDPEREPGSGVSYGDRGGGYGYLRRVRSGTGSAWSGRSGAVSTSAFSAYTVLDCGLIFGLVLIGLWIVDCG